MKKDIKDFYLSEEIFDNMLSMDIGKTLKLNLINDNNKLKTIVLKRIK